MFLNGITYTGSTRLFLRLFSAGELSTSSSVARLAIDDARLRLFIIHTMNYPCRRSQKNVLEHVRFSLTLRQHWYVFDSSIASKPDTGLTNSFPECTEVYYTDVRNDRKTLND